MSKSVLIAYATRYGSTREVAEAIRSVLSEKGLDADVQNIRDIRDISDIRSMGSVPKYDAIVLGAPLYMFRLHKDARRFLSGLRKIQQMGGIPKLAVFAVGPVQEPYNEIEWSGANDQLNKELAKFPWIEPVETKIFGGRFDPAGLSFPMSMFAGKIQVSDIRDWDDIKSWAGQLAAKL